MRAQANLGKGDYRAMFRRKTTNERRQSPFMPRFSGLSFDEPPLGTRNARVIAY
jgi:hypothetical protein